MHENIFLFSTTYTFHVLFCLVAPGNSQQCQTNDSTLKNSSSFFKIYISIPVDPTKADPVIVKTETEAGEFEKEIEKLRVHGGGDCPEYTFEGMRGALNKMEMVGSPLYVFTDAGPKDATEADIEEVKEIAQSSGVAINFLTTGKGNACCLYIIFLQFKFSTYQLYLRSIVKTKPAVNAGYPLVLSCS